MCECQNKKGAAARSPTPVQSRSGLDTADRLSAAADRLISLSGGESFSTGSSDDDIADRGLIMRKPDGRGRIMLTPTGQRYYWQE